MFLARVICRLHPIQVTLYRIEPWPATLITWYATIFWTLLGHLQYCSHARPAGGARAQNANLKAEPAGDHRERRRLVWALLTGLLLPDTGRTAGSARTTPVSNAGCTAGPSCKQQSALPDVPQRQHACTCQEAKQGARSPAELCTILSTVSDVWGTRGSSCRYWRTCSTKHAHELKHAKHTAGMLAKLLDALKHRADRQSISAKCQAQGKGLTGYRRVCSWEN